MKVSAVLSIHNRSTLFRRAIDSYVMQTMDPRDWEIVLVDDNSTEDLAKTYAHLVGKINLRHVRMNGARHPKYAGFHTPALSINLGTFLARGDVICLCHPEVIHAPTNFDQVFDRASHEKVFLFGKCWLGTAVTNQKLAAGEYWRLAMERDGDGHVTLPFYGPEFYWFLSFIQRAAIEHVGGVDFEYLGGVAGEDDDFRIRVERAGWFPAYDSIIQGLHQYHGDDKDAWDFKAKAEKERFDAALNRNRALLYARKGEPRPEFSPTPCGPGFPQPANQGYDWRARKCFERMTEYFVGSTEPVVTE